MEIEIKLMAIFDQEFNSDEESWEKKGHNLLKIWNEADEKQRELINQVLMALCGWEMETLLNKAQDLIS